MLKNDLLLRAAHYQETERIPVWLMRQAGRILPEYRVVRSSVKDFKELVRNPDLVCEVTMQPVEILEVDAAIIFSDILVLPEAMGLNYEMIESQGPLFPTTIQTIADIAKLSTDVEQKLGYVSKSIQYVKAELADRIPLIGFAGAPWTILAYMIEGHGSKTFSKAKKFLYTQPQAAHKLLDKITTATIRYLEAQIHAGVDIIQIFDSWAGMLSESQYKSFALPYMKRITDEIQEVPIILFAKGAHYILESFAQTRASVIGLDWTMNPTHARSLTPGKALQGNLDPCLLYADREIIKHETEAMLSAFGPKGYIANLGHGVYPDTPYQNVQYFIEVIKNFRF